MRGIRVERQGAAWRRERRLHGRYHRTPVLDHRCDDRNDQDRPDEAQRHDSAGAVNTCPGSAISERGRVATVEERRYRKSDQVFVVHKPHPKSVRSLGSPEALHEFLQLWKATPGSLS